jgi:hypothetical protein
MIISFKLKKIFNFQTRERFAVHGVRLDEEDLGDRDAVVRGVVTAPSHPRRRVQVRARQHHRNRKANVAGHGVSWKILNIREALDSDIIHKQYLYYYY